jgi:hypothetical protein
VLVTGASGRTWVLAASVNGGGTSEFSALYLISRPENLDPSLVDDDVSTISPSVDPDWIWAWSREHLALINGSEPLIDRKTIVMPATVRDVIPTAEPGKVWVKVANERPDGMLGRSGFHRAEVRSKGSLLQ